MSHGSSADGSAGGPPPLPALRQVVLLAADLNSVLQQARDYLGLNPGVREEEGER